MDPLQNVRFDPLNCFFARISQFPILSGDTDPSAILEKYKINKSLRAALAVANPSLYQALIQTEETGRVEKQTLHSLMKVFLRTCSRATPLGLYSSVAIGAFSSSQIKLNFDGNQSFIQATYDREWIDHFIDHAHTTCLPCLRIMANPGIYRQGNRLLLQKASVNQNRRSYYSIQSTSAIRQILLEAKHPILCQELTSVIAAQFPHVSQVKIDHCIQNLIQKGYILTELQIPALSPALLLSRFRQLPHCEELCLLLEELEKRTSVLETSSPCNCLESVVGIQELTSGRNTRFPPLYINTYARGEFSLPESVQSTVLQALEMAFLCSDRDSVNQFSQFHAHFLDRFSRDTLVPVTHILEDLQFQSLLSPLESTKTEKQGFNLWDIIAQGTMEIDLEKTLASMPCLGKGDLATIPPSAEVYFELGAKSEQALEQGDYTVLIHNFSLQIGSCMGRFVNSSQKEMIQGIREIYQKEEAVLPDFAFVEPLFLPDDPFLANRCSAYSLRTLQLKQFYSDANNQDLPFDDIYLGASFDGLYLFSKKLHKKLYFVLSSALNIQLIPPIIRSLILISRMKTLGEFCPFWDMPISSRFKPRIRYRNIVFSPAKWSVSYPDLQVEESTSKRTVKEKLLQFFQSNQISNRCALVQADNRLNLNWKNSEHFEILVEEYIRNKNIVVTEAIFSESDWVVTSEQGKHVAEFVAQFVRKKNSVVPSNMLPTDLRYADLSSKNRVFFPGSGWLYMKIFISEEEMECFIHDLLFPFAERLSKEGFIQLWFYIRYKEEQKSHIRVRFYTADINQSNILIDQVSAWIGQIILDQQCDDMAFCPYHREIEKYGGFDGIEQVERFFWMNSVSCAKLLSWFNKSNLFERFVAASFGIFHILARLFGEDLSKIILFLAPSENTKHLLAGMRPLSRQAIPFFRSIWECDIDSFVYSIYTESEKTLDEIKQLFPRIPKQRAEDLIDHLIHMHCNRFLGTSRLLEQKARVACYYFSSRFQASKKGLNHLESIRS